jgi:hypothetical protein
MPRVSLDQSAPDFSLADYRGNTVSLAVFPGKRTITLNPKQQRHVEILTRLEAGALDVATAAGRSIAPIRPWWHRSWLWPAPTASTTT